MIDVARAVSTYVVPREHRAAGELRHRADRVLRERVPELLPAMTAEAFQGDAVWLVRRVDVDFAFDATLGDDALARAWSEEIVRGLAAAVRRDEAVLRFASRAAFVAQYVADTAAGRAANRWYYAQFASLDALPAESMLRVAITREPSIAFAILVELARMRRLRLVVDALSAIGLREVWELAFPQSASGVEPRAALIESLLAVWDPVAARTPLQLAAAVLEIVQTPVDAHELRVHIEALLALAAMLRETAEPWALVEAIIDGDAPTAIALASARGRIPDVATLRFLTQLASTNPAVVTCAASTITATTDSPATFTDGDFVPTRFAALALLLPVLADLGLLNADSASPLRVLVVARCAGAREVLDDPIARLFAGDALEGEDRAHHDLIATLASIAVLKSFAARLPGFANSSTAHLRENFLAGAGAIHLDGNRIDVHLPPLPLALVLRIAGMCGQPFTVPWLPERTITLRLSEQP